MTTIVSNHLSTRKILSRTEKYFKYPKKFPRQTVFTNREANYVVSISDCQMRISYEKLTLEEFKLIRGLIHYVFQGESVGVFTDNNELLRDIKDIHFLNLN